MLSACLLEGAGKLSALVKHDHDVRDATADPRVTPRDRQSSRIHRECQGEGNRAHGNSVNRGAILSPKSYHCNGKRMLLMFCNHWFAA